MNFDKEHHKLLRSTSEIFKMEAVKRNKIQFPDNNIILSGEKPELKLT